MPGVGNLSPTAHYLLAIVVRTTYDCVTGHYFPFGVSSFGCSRSVRLSPRTFKRGPETLHVHIASHLSPRLRPRYPQLALSALLNFRSDHANHNSAAPNFGNHQWEV